MIAASEWMQRRSENAEAAPNAQHDPHALWSLISERDGQFGHSTRGSKDSGTADNGFGSDHFSGKSKCFGISKEPNKCLKSDGFLSTGNLTFGPLDHDFSVFASFWRI